MKKITFLVLGCVTIGLSMTAEGASSAPLPAGTYTQSCTNCTYTNNILTCSCPLFTNGPSLQTTLNTANCPAGQNIDNCNGSLLCGYCLPSGNYNSPLNTSFSSGGNCKNCSYDGTTLSCATCPIGGGFTTRSTLSVGTCQGQPIVNCAGTLRCGSCPLPTSFTINNSYNTSGSNNPCNNCSFDGTILSCLCPHITNGPSFLTSLPISSCSFVNNTIGNCNGTLVAGPIGSFCPSLLTNTFNSVTPPTGPYQTSCRNCFFNGTILACTCTTNPTNPTSTTTQIASLNTTTCQQGQSISNCNGLLVCGTCPTALQSAQNEVTGIIKQLQNLEINNPVTVDTTLSQPLQELLTAATAQSVGIQQTIVPQLATPFLQRAFTKVQQLLPTGSYQSTCDCTTCSFDGTTLTCDCFTTPPTLTPPTSTTSLTANSSLVITTCQGQDIANCNGTLTCGVCPTQSSSQSTPSGNPGNPGSSSGTTPTPTTPSGNPSGTTPQNTAPTPTPAATRTPAAPALPKGTYNKNIFGNCKNCSLSGTQLTCSCPQPPDYVTTFGTTTVDISTCAQNSGISNCDGELVCGACQLPEGTYKEDGECAPCVCSGRTLACKCPKIPGTPSPLVTSYLPYINCDQDINNCSGILTCGDCPSTPVASQPIKKYTTVGAPRPGFVPKPKVNKKKK